MRAFTIIALLFLVACGGPAAPTATGVEERLTSAGASNFHEDAIVANSPLPRSFTTRRAFTMESVAPKGGQYFICDAKRDCDAIAAYFNALKALAGPYIYQSPSGLVVVQLNSGLTPGEAEKVAQVVAGL